MRSKTRGKTILVTAHRMSWLMHNGPIADGLLVCHRCDVRKWSTPRRRVARHRVTATVRGFALNAARAASGTEAEHTRRSSREAIGGARLRVGARGSTLTR